MAPISSRRPAAGTAVSRWPSATAVIAEVIACSGSATRWRSTSMPARPTSSARPESTANSRTSRSAEAFASARLASARAITLSVRPPIASVSGSMSR